LYEVVVITDTGPYAVFVLHLQQHILQLRLTSMQKNIAKSRIPTKKSKYLLPWVGGSLSFSTSKLRPKISVVYVPGKKRHFS